MGKYTRSRGPNEHSLTIPVHSLNDARHVGMRCRTLPKWHAGRCELAQRGAARRAAARRRTAAQCAALKSNRSNSAAFNNMRCSLLLQAAAAAAAIQARAIRSDTPSRRARSPYAHEAPPPSGSEAGKSGPVLKPTNVAHCFQIRHCRTVPAPGTWLLGVCRGRGKCSAPAARKARAGAGGGRQNGESARNAKRSGRVRTAAQCAPGQARRLHTHTHRRCPDGASRETWLGE